ncbi:hypothetical protein ACRDNQ_06880 [Palleronia sp. KMU-117]|uniref:hypothetical protein n=1 Tax=Palleronia sp. KMU-117 TaxID=3434108 RepID=UPI003D73611B
MKILLCALAVSTAACAALPALSDASGAATLRTLHGTYVSPAVEEWYGGYGTREFVFADGQWSLIFTHALDPAMTMRTFQFRTGGAYRVGAASQIVEGAYDTVFDEDWKHVTLLTDVPEIIAGMGMADCGLTVNLETDISASGCAAWAPVAVCGEDHDLIALSDEGLHFGQRPADNDMCTADKRPTALLPAVVAR